MQEDLKLKERIVNQIALAEVAADNFMHELKQQKPEDSFEISLATKDYTTMLSLLNGILTETGNTCFTIYRRRTFSHTLGLELLHSSLFSVYLH